MKEIKLKKNNSRKYCLNCKKITEIGMNGLRGYCCDCGELRYTIDNRKKEKKIIYN